MKKLTFIFIFFLSVVGYSQVTSSSITGFVKSNLGERLPGVTVQAIHTPTGTKYYGETDGAGGYSIPSVRPGGPYTVKVAYLGYYYSYENGSLQFLSYTSQSLYKEFKDELETLLNGLEVSK